VPAYAEAMVAAGEWEARQSLDRARCDFEQRLPQGVNTAGHSLYGIYARSSGQRVGDLWLQYRCEANQPVCIVLDLFIAPPERRRGYAQASLCIAETMARASGAVAMRLNVLGDNQAARSLYDKSGYSPLSVRLSKSLISN